MYTYTTLSIIPPARPKSAGAYLSSTPYNIQFSIYMHAQCTVTYLRWDKDETKFF